MDLDWLKARMRGRGSHGPSARTHGGVRGGALAATPDRSLRSHPRQSRPLYPPSVLLFANANKQEHVPIFYSSAHYLLRAVSRVTVQLEAPVSPGRYGGRGQPGAPQEGGEGLGCSRPAAAASRCAVMGTRAPATDASGSAGRGGCWEGREHPGGPGPVGL